MKWVEISNFLTVGYFVGQIHNDIWRVFSPPFPHVVSRRGWKEAVCVRRERGCGGDFRGYAAFAMWRRVVDASHVEDDGAERLN